MTVRGVQESLCNRSALESERLRLGTAKSALSKNANDELLRLPPCGNQSRRAPCTRHGKEIVSDLSGHHLACLPQRLTQRPAAPLSEVQCAHSLCEAL